MVEIKTGWMRLTTLCTTKCSLVVSIPQTFFRQPGLSRFFMNFWMLFGIGFVLCISYCLILFVIVSRFSHNTLSIVKIPLTLSCFYSYAIGPCVLLCVQFVFHSPLFTPLFTAFCTGHIDNTLKVDVFDRDLMGDIPE